MPYLGDSKEQALVNTIGLINDRPCGRKNSMQDLDYAVQPAANEDDNKHMNDETTATPTNTSEKNDSEYKSRPPTPPTRPDSPVKLLPQRLQAYIPPSNFGAVTDHQVFRSAYPQERNIAFLTTLNVKTLLVFVDTEPSAPYTDFVNTHKVSRLHIPIAPNKDGAVKTSIASICQALLVVLDSSNYPLHIHCNQGRHRTGCVIACLRKVQGWPLDAILAEYSAYASPKTRPGDVKFISEVFQPECLIDYAQQHASFEHRPSLTQLLRSGLVDVPTLVRILGVTDGVQKESTSLMSEGSKPDSGVELASTMATDGDNSGSERCEGKGSEIGSCMVDPALLMGTRTEAAQHASQAEVEVEVTECDPMSPPVSADNLAAGGGFFQTF